MFVLHFWLMARLMYSVIKGVLILNLVFLLIGAGRPAVAEDIKISLAEIPKSSFYNEEHQLVGGFPELLRLVDQYYLEGNLVLEAFPFARSINNVLVNKHDAHVPLPGIDSALKDDSEFQFVDEPLLEVAFVIYSHKDNPITRHDNLHQLSIDTLIGHTDFFDFKVGTVVTFETGLKKVINKRVDAFIMEQDVVDRLIRDTNLIAIHRSLYAALPTSLIVSKSDRGNDLNRALSSAIRRAKNDPRYHPITQTIHKTYIDWQPYE